MRKFLASTLAAVTFGGAVAATAAPAEARDRYYRYRDRDNDAAAAAIIAGVAGLAIGAALASDNDRRYYRGGYYRPGYYDYGPGYYPAPRYGYGYGYRTCTRRERHWDPYYGGYVTVKRRYAC